MSPAWIVSILLLVLALAGFLYWQLVVAEGAYLGRRIVALLYDWFAPRYDQVKEYDPDYEAFALALPVLEHCGVDQPAHVLDVASGTGRLPAALFAQPRFAGQFTALDASARMLAVAKTKLAPHAMRIRFMHAPAVPLPFDSADFEVVSCLEALEFFPDPDAAIREMLRVLKPGGLLMITNRIGPDAWKLPGLARPSLAVSDDLSRHGCLHVRIEAWLTDYDLIFAIKPA